MYELSVWGDNVTVFFAKARTISTQTENRKHTSQQVPNPLANSGMKPEVLARARRWHVLGAYTCTSTKIDKKLLPRRCAHFNSDHMYMMYVA
jgi:hypothetical protein